MKKLNVFIDTNFNKIVLAILVLTSLAANIFFYDKFTSKGIGNNDSWSRLNIARRVTDNLTPGIAQIGGVWLPFPQLLIVPLAHYDFLYYTGLAGAVISSIAFVMGGVYLGRLSLNLTNNKLTTITSLLFYCSNVNLLLLQTTSMSEPLFLCSVIASAFYFERWLRQTKLLDLFLLAGWVVVSSLTRYEGYLLFAMSVALVSLVSLYKFKRLKTSEGMILLFGTLSSLGILIWMLYSLLIFKDPLNWWKIYSHQKPVISTLQVVPEESVRRTTSNEKKFKNLESTLTSFVQMSGLPLVSVSVIGIILLIKEIVTHRRLAKTGLLLLILSPSLFLIYAAQKGSNLLDNPTYSFSDLFDRQYYLKHETNVRYGIIAFPIFLILAIVAAKENKILSAGVFSVAVVQAILIFTNSLTIVYNIPLRMMSQSKTSPNEKIRTWLHENYDQGLILISANKNDPLMYHLKLPYKKYIFEGTGIYWKESVVEPTKYANWIIMENGAKPKSTDSFFDVVSYYLKDTETISINYTEMYKDEKYIVYKRNW